MYELSINVNKGVFFFNQCLFRVEELLRIVLHTWDYTLVGKTSNQIITGQKLCYDICFESHKHKVQ